MPRPLGSMRNDPSAKKLADMAMSRRKSAALGYVVAAVSSLKSAKSMTIPEVLADPEIELEDVRKKIDAIIQDIEKIMKLYNIGRR